MSAPTPPTSMAQMQVTITQLMARIAQLEAEPGIAQTIVNELSKNDSTKAKIDQPAKYGGDKEALTGFLTSAKAYLQYYPNKFADEAAKVTFVASRLDGKALRWFEPTLKDRLENPLEDSQEDFTKKVFKKYATFEEEIIKVFGDTDEKLHAQERLARLRQTKSASAYATIFRQDSLRAEINDEGLMQLFYDGLKEEVKDELYKVDRPETLDDYIAMAIRIDDRQFTQATAQGPGWAQTSLPGQRQEEARRALRSARHALRTHGHQRRPAGSRPSEEGQDRRHLLQLRQEGPLQEGMSQPKEGLEASPRTRGGDHRQTHPSGGGRSRQLHPVGLRWITPCAVSGESRVPALRGGSVSWV